MTEARTELKPASHIVADIFLLQTRATEEAAFFYIVNKCGCHWPTGFYVEVLHRQRVPIVPGGALTLCGSLQCGLRAEDCGGGGLSNGWRQGPS